MLICFTVVCVLRFLSLYKAARTQLDNYYTDQMYNFVLWIRRSIIFIVIFGVVSVVVLFAPYTFRVVYFVAATIMNVYIAMSFINYSFVFERVERSFRLNYEQQILLKKPQAHSSSNNKTGVLTDAQKGLMRIWLSNEEYCNSELTIDSVAREIKTNRSYLSRYINETYNSNFSSWISSLRIRKAKQIMQSETTLTIEEI
ncbi:helix-turn-helix domain-containing protein, partial [Prevotella falsenii]|uniref:helix-turn-helix domain-containing protein n=1 Tax=Prevotella falsenii TaxID=515414 RepID=UPI00357165A5